MIPVSPPIKKSERKPKANNIGAGLGQGIGKPSAAQSEGAGTLRGMKPLSPDLIAPAARRLGVKSTRLIAQHHTVRRFSGPFADGADALVLAGFVTQARQRSGWFQAQMADVAGQVWVTRSTSEAVAGRAAAVPM